VHMFSMTLWVTIALPHSRLNLVFVGEECGGARFGVDCVPAALFIRLRIDL